MHCSISLFPNLLYVFLSMLSRELVGASLFDTQTSTSMYLLFSNPLIFFFLTNMSSPIVLFRDLSNNRLDGNLNVIAEMPSSVNEL